MKFGKFNITNMIKAGTILIFALMLNIAGLNNSNAQGYNPRPVTTMGAYAPTAREAVERSTEKIEFVEVETAAECSAAVFRAQHTAGCWSCLVVERLTSAFLNAAKHGLPITQKAGVIILVLGTILWVLKWGLDNVSSFSEIQLANILNTLFQTCFKVMLAYWFIVLSTNAISQYFIRPIMSVGAIIGQNMWNEEVKEQTEVWDDLADVDITDEVEKAEKAQQEEAKKQDKKEIEIDQETLSELEARMEKDSASKSEIPPFQMPGCNGTITSFPGCRVPPPTNNQTNCGSFSHMGLDIGAQNGTPIWAIAGGNAVYSKSGSWGNMVKITTKHKGATWTHLYAHMNDADWNKYKQYHAQKGYKVARGEIIGGVGNTGSSGGNHLHIELILNGTVDGVKYDNEVVEPISLADGKIVVRGKKSGSPTGVADKDGCSCGKGGNPGCSYHKSWNPASKAQEAEKKKNKICRGFNSTDPSTSIRKNSKVPNGGITNPGTKAETITTAYISGGDQYVADSFDFYEAPTIPEIDYTGPTNIVPRSIMNSLLGALRVITNTTAENLVLGKMIMCYAGQENGGAWTINILIGKIVITNGFMWLQGLTIFIAGLMLTIAIAYYFLDISFKLGFSVLAMPIAAGLWPFNKTKDKLTIVISIMLKASASFAFMALITSYGMALISESLNDTSVLYEKIEQVSQGASDTDIDEVNAYIEDTIWIFSSTFIMMLFSMFYFYKLVSKTIKSFVDKFFPDQTFGSSNPMHETATLATSKALNPIKKAGSLAKDIVAHQTGQRVQNAVKGLGRAVGSGANKVANGAINKFRGK